jgi:hypothetical protein
MLFHSVRKMLLIGAAVAALAVPGIAAADHDLTTSHDNHRARDVRSIDMAAVVDAESPVLSELSNDDCRFLEMNIPGYACEMSLAQWAAVDAMNPYPAPPAGVDYLFWEQNVWELADGGAYPAWVITPEEPVIEADDVSFPLEGFAAY